jgi:bifunctional UDP-N-acetylglucosamine pyrophosphorylase/glucosamine-1-phosphate N-acetyltransferase
MPRRRRANTIKLVPGPTVVILAAGVGTRMRSSTPKVLHEVCGRPMVLWPVIAAREAGAERVVVVDSPARALEAALPEYAEIAVQPEPDGTGGAVAAALAHLDSPDTRADGSRASDSSAADEVVVVLSGDVPLVSAEVIRELLRTHAREGAAATIVTARLDDPRGYGRIIRDRDGGVERVVETKTDGDASAREREVNEVNAGIYAFSAGALRTALPELGAENAQRERYLPEVLGPLIASGGTIAAHVLEDPLAMLGVNDRAALARVRKLAQRAIHERHMSAGVDIVDPDATVIDVGVTIGADTVIEPFTTIKGETRIGAGCLVRHAYLVDCVLEDAASVGPFAYLRPGALLRAGAKVGTFVEVKNSDIGSAAKVPHLSYIGDADVGEQTNLGAGTITANYDGREKHRTRIGKRVRGGVHTSLVAPVTIGDDAYTAAGSVLTKDVPAGALGVARSEQENVEGFTERRERSVDSGEE